MVKPSNAKKYYKYHRNWSHSTNECVTLKNEIEDLICKGNLWQYKKFDQGKTQQLDQSRNKQPLVKDNSNYPSYSLQKKKMNEGKEIAYNLGTIDMVEVIA